MTLGITPLHIYQPNKQNIMIKEIILKLDPDQIWGLGVGLILLIGLTIYIVKSSSEIDGHRFKKFIPTKKKITQQEIDEKKQIQTYAMNYILTHKDKFIRKHYAQFIRIFIQGVNYQKNKTL